MRIFTVILATFILALSLKPCADDFSEEAAIAIMDGSDSHEHSSDSDDPCSSTCICECCGIPLALTITIPFKITETRVIPIKIAKEYYSIYAFDFFSNIWQPPQVG